MFLKIFRNISCVRAARNGVVASFYHGRATSRQDTMLLPQCALVLPGHTERSTLYREGCAGMNSTDIIPDLHRHGAWKYHTVACTSQLRSHPGQIICQVLHTSISEVDTRPVPAVCAGPHLCHVQQDKHLVTLQQRYVTAGGAEAHVYHLTVLAEPLGGQALLQRFLAPLRHLHGFDVIHVDLQSRYVGE